MRRPFLPNASVRSIISTAVAALSIAALLGLLVITVVAYRLNARVDRLTNETYSDESIAHRTVNEVQQQMLLAMQYVYTPDPALRDEFRRIGNEAYQNTRLYLQRKLTVQERQQVERIKELHEQFEIAAQSVFALADRGNSTAAQVRARGLAREARAMQAELDSFLARRRTHRSELQAYRVSMMKWLMAAGAVLAALMLVITISVRRILLRRLVEPLTLLARGVRRVDETTLDVEVPVHTQDEIGLLASDFNEMGKRLQRARESADQSRDSYTRLVESMDALIWEAPAATGACTFVNSYAEKLLGYPIEDWLDNREIWQRIIHPDEYESVMAECAASTLLGHNHVIEYRAVKKEGSTIWLRDVISVSTRPEDGATMLHGVMFDVTAEREAENALRESEERFRALIENASDTVTVVAADGKTLYSGPSLVSVLGFTMEERMGRNVLDLIHPDDLPVAKNVLESALRGGQTTTLELRARHADGGYRWIEVKARNLLDHPAVRGIVINSRDINDRKIAEMELASTTENLRQAQKMEAIGKLAGGIAHDFNNLLTAIRGYSQLVLDSNTSGGAREELTEISKAAERASELTAQLLAFSRKQLQNAEVLDLNNVLADMQRLCSRVLGEHIDIVMSTTDEPATVYADKSQMEQVILNLAVNARDAMNKGGVLKMSIERITQRRASRGRYEIPEGQYVVLRVQDSGTGMPAEVVARVFDPFFTTKDVGRGTGLGLSTVYGIVKQSNGFIYVDSEVGNGSTFTVLLPYVDRPAAAARARRAVPAALDGTERVLVVEDEPAVRALAKRILERKGYHVTTAENGLEAIEKLKAELADVVIADMVMPRMGGAELAARMTDEFPAIPVVLMSGYSEDEVLQQVTRKNPNTRFIGKPYSAEDLLMQVREALRSVA